MSKKNYSKEFKARLALESLRGEKTIQELAQIHGVYPNMITKWKKQLGVYPRSSSRSRMS